MFIFFVAEDPFGANDVLALGGRLKDPYIVAGKVVLTLRALPTTNPDP
jgi:hypothetical protein